MEDHPSNQASEGAQAQALPLGPSRSAGNEPKSPSKSTQSTSLARKSPLKAWNRQARTPNIDHLRPNPSSASSLKTINKSGNGKKHVSAFLSVRLVHNKTCMASK